MPDFSNCSRGKSYVYNDREVVINGHGIGCAWECNIGRNAPMVAKANAELWADATNTLTKTGKAASQLAEELETARETIRHMADELRRLKPERHNEQDILDSVCSQD